MIPELQLYRHDASKLATIQNTCEDTTSGDAFFKTLGQSMQGSQGQWRFSDRIHTVPHTCYSFLPLCRVNIFQILQKIAEVHLRFTLFFNGLFGFDLPSIATVIFVHWPQMCHKKLIDAVSSCVRLVPMVPSRAFFCFLQCRRLLGSACPHSSSGSRQVSIRFCGGVIQVSMWWFQEWSKSSGLSLKLPSTASRPIAANRSI